MAVMFWFVAVVLGIGGMVGFVMWMENSDQPGDKVDEKSIAMKFGASALCFVLMVVSVMGGFYFDKVTDVTKMVAFQLANQQAYQYTIDKTESLITVYASDTEKAKLVEGSIEKIEIATAVAERLKELRDDVTEYNERLAYLERMNSIPIIKIAYPGTGDLKYIVLE